MELSFNKLGAYLRGSSPVTTLPTVIGMGVSLSPHLLFDMSWIQRRCGMPEDKSIYLRAVERPPQKDHNSCQPTSKWCRSNRQVEKKLMLLIMSNIARKKPGLHDSILKRISYKSLVRFLFMTTWWFFAQRPCVWITSCVRFSTFLPLYYLFLVFNGVNYSNSSDCAKLPANEVLTENTGPSTIDTMLLHQPPFLLIHLNALTLSFSPKSSPQKSEIALYKDSGWNYNISRKCQVFKQ